MKTEISQAAFDTLVEHVATSSDVSSIRDCIDTARHHIFSGTSPMKAIELLPAPVARIVQQDTLSATALDQVLGNLHTRLSTIEILHLTLPYVPTLAEEQEISALCKKKLGSDTVIEIHTDPTLLAGVQMERGGKQSEYSLRNQLVERAHQGMQQTI